MILFLVSNFLISSLAISHNRLGKTSIYARLVVSSFALLCWVIPFSLIREVFPKDAGVDLGWVVPQSFEIIELSTTEQLTPVFDLSLFQVFLFASLIGAIISLVRLIRHFNWMKNLKASSPSAPVKHYQDIPVYISNSIKNALLVGYRKPSIWINQELVGSKYLNIVLAHESTHSRFKDNYWLLVVEVIQNLYWWNPIVRLLTNDFTELLEARCDHKASQSFSNNSYQKQLASLMLTAQFDFRTNLNSAVISKNPDVRRLHYLTEKPTMNFLSKMSVSFLFVITIILLTIPVASLNTFANESNTEFSESERFSLSFKVMPIAVATEILGELYQVKEVVVAPTLETIVFKNFSVDKVNLAELSTITNINWEILNSNLVISPRTGEVKVQIMTDEEFEKNGDAVSTSSTNNNDGDKLGALLKLELRSISIENGVQNTKTKETTIWADFDKPFSMKFDDTREVSFIVVDRDDKILINAKVYSLNEGEQKKLIGNPKIFSNYGGESTIEIGNENGGKWSMSIYPTKTTNPNS
ncbi:MAG: M56 family metallopeptidase [Kangiellaceae bacterium]|nr:M56 family metallopeptidase [Kangiellaceae bacterium]